MFLSKRTIVVGSAALVAVSLGLWFVGRPAYRRHQEADAVARAKKAVAEGDFRSASLSVRRALAINPRSLEACQIMALIAELAHSPQVLDWCGRVVELSPTVENKLTLAAAALKVQGPPYPLAAQTLEQLAGVAKDRAAYQVISAELALKLNHLEEAEARFGAAIRLEPTNELHRLNLAVLQLRSTNQVAVGAARATLEGLRADKNLAPVALRWLVQDAMQRKNLSDASEFSKQLLADKTSTVEDRLQHLGILRQSQISEFDAYLAAVQQQAVTNANEVYSVSSWMVANGLGGQALGWLTNCPAALQAERPASMARVDCYIAAKDWAKVETYLDEQKWGEWDFMRLAFLSRAAAERKDHLTADGRWRLAVQQAGERMGPLTALLTMAGNWQNQTAQEDLLWRISQKFPSERWPLTELEKLYVTSGNTRGLNRLYATIVERDGKDYVARNNQAATSMLLRSNLPKAYAVARELHEAHPAEPIIVCTYAYSLHLQGRTAEGVAEFEKLKLEALRNPAIALYYGLLLNAQGSAEKARQFLSLGRRATLLPEERELVVQTMDGH